MLDVFRHGEREVLISLKKYQVSSLNEKGVKAVVLGSQSSDTEIKDRCAKSFVYKVGTMSRGF